MIAFAENKVFSAKDKKKKEITELNKRYHNFNQIGRTNHEISNFPFKDMTP